MAVPEVPEARVGPEAPRGKAWAAVMGDAGAAIDGAEGVARRRQEPGPSAWMARA